MVVLLMVLDELELVTGPDVEVEVGDPVPVLGWLVKVAV